MVRVRKVAGGRTNIRGIGHYEVGDEDDVSPADAEYLVEERGDFEYVDEPSDEDEPAVETEDASADTELDEASTSSTEEVTTDSTANDDAEDESEDVSEDGDDYEERTAAAEALADEHWQRAVSAVEDGEADDYLDILEQVDDRNSVQDAIEERREALEG